jgi:sugar phosphate isomerase/epimerase
VAKAQVGVQLIIFGKRTQHDLAGVLSDVAKVGYAGFEGGAPAAPAEFEKLQATVKQSKIAYIGGHLGLGDLADTDLLRKRIGNVKALGGRFLISSGNSGLKTIDAYLDAAKALNEAGRLCQEQGITLCYHNHHWEFRKIDGQVPMHAMIAATDAKLVKLCTDVYWVHVGGEKPAEFIDCYRDRGAYFHFKDGTGGDGASDFRELGRGAVDIPAALKAALSCNPAWIVVEQDTTQIDPVESCRISREYLKSLGM